MRCLVQSGNGRKPLPVHSPARGGVTPVSESIDTGYPGLQSLGRPQRALSPAAPHVQWAQSPVLGHGRTGNGRRERGGGWGSRQVRMAPMGRATHVLHWLPQGEAGRARIHQRMPPCGWGSPQLGNPNSWNRQQSRITITAVNTYPGPVHTARHAVGCEPTRRPGSHPLVPAQAVLVRVVAVIGGL